MSLKPVLMVYGNCQAGALAAILAADRGISERFAVRYYPSFDDRVPGSRDLDPATVRATTLLFEQHDPEPFPFHDLLPPSCTTVRYPSIDLHLLWPLNCVNPYNDEPTTELPWGRFPYGDRVIVDCVNRGLSVDETLTFYRSASAQALPNLDRYYDMEKARLVAREAKCDVPMSDYLFDRLSLENLFWCVNHPTADPLKELSRRLLARAADALPESCPVDLDEAIAATGPGGPLSFYRVPIHPAIVDHFDLAWYRKDDGVRYGLRAAPLSYHDYLSGMAETAIRKRKMEAISAS